jgi:hypothetical protein
MIWYALHHSNSPLSYIENKDSNGKINPTFTMWEHFCTVTAHFLGELDSTEEKEKVFEKTSSSLASLTSMVSLYFHLTNLKLESLVFRQKSFEILKTFPVERAEVALIESAEKVFKSQSLTEKLRKLLMPDHSSSSKPEALETDIEENVLQSTNEMLRNKKFFEAEQSYKTILESSDSKEMIGRAANNLCHLLFKRNRLEEALKYAQIKVENAPLDFKGYFWMSLIYSRMIFKESELQRDDLAAFADAHSLICGTFKEIAIYLHGQNQKTVETRETREIKETGETKESRETEEKRNNKVTKKLFATIKNARPPMGVAMVSSNTELEIALEKYPIILLKEGEYELQNRKSIGSSIIGLGNVRLNLVSSNNDLLVLKISSVLIGNISMNVKRTLIIAESPESPMVILNTKIDGSVDWSAYQEKQRQLKLKSIPEKLLEVQQKRTNEARDDLLCKYKETAIQVTHGPLVSVCIGKLFLIFCEIQSPHSNAAQSGSTKHDSLSLEQKPILYLFESDILNCKELGIAVNDGGSVICIRSNIHHNQMGLLISVKALRADVIGCNIYENTGAGIGSDMGDPTSENDTRVRVINSAVYNNKFIGVSVGSMNSLLLKGNQIFGNKSIGIDVQRPKQVIVRDNDIHHNECGGIQVRMAKFENCFFLDNTIHHNSGPDICQYVFSDNDGNKDLDVMDPMFRKPIYLLGNICYNNIHHQWLKVFIIFFGN